MRQYNIEPFERGLDELNLHLTNHQMIQFVKFYEILEEWNQWMNLTAITEFQEVVSKHFLDSLLLVKAYDMTNVKNIIDVGTGAGFPGIPLKIVFPEINFVLLDSLGKRTMFLKEVISELRVEQIEVIHGRAEDLGRTDGYRESFDLVVSRAVANLASLSEYGIPFAKKGGAFVPYKSGNIKEELESSQKAISILGGKVSECKELILPETDIVRNFVIIEKVKNTSKKYPRKAGLPTKEPLM